jgi:hypothetical protein
MFKQEVNSRVMQSIRLETTWKAIPRDLLICLSVGHKFLTWVDSTGNVLDIIQGGNGVQIIGKLNFSTIQPWPVCLIVRVRRLEMMSCDPLQMSDVCSILSIRPLPPVSTVHSTVASISRPTTCFAFCLHSVFICWHDSQNDHFL